MKRIFITLFITLSLNSIAQIEIHSENGEIVGNEITVIEHQSIFQILNTTNQPLKVNYSQTKEFKLADCGVTLHDYFNCFSPDTDFWLHPNMMILNIPAGDSTYLLMNYNCTEGCTINTYHFYDLNNNLIDSMQVTFNLSGENCFLENPEFLALKTTLVYPNPVVDMLNIEVTNDEVDEVIIYDILGNVVVEHMLINGINQLNIEHLTSGVYFYALKGNNDILETKKLVVKK